MIINYDIIVIGGGHAGIEAATAAASLGCRVGLLSLPHVPIGNSPCNPSVGGVGKGQVVREIDALGGVMGKLADLSGIQYRTLNESKGYAVRSTRVQIDKSIYAQEALKQIQHTPNLSLILDRLVKLHAENDGFTLELQSDKTLFAKSVIVTSGTFLKGLMHVGAEKNAGGLIEDKDSQHSSKSFLDELNLPLKRFKTGTPARLVKDSIDYSSFEVQDSDPSTLNFHFEFTPQNRTQEQLSCYLSRTTETTLNIIRDNKERSPLFNGQIQGTGPRYCPSIEDKAFRYPDRHIHHVFIEPEGINLDTMYPSGVSTSLPKDVQLEFLRTIPGLEQVEIKTYGYAVEYDVIDSSQLYKTLEYHHIPNLYFAGQINGTSGYEEAAAQGLVAGFNSALKILGKSPLIFKREDSYIGVLIEDLVSNSRDEPYRLFTARAENRLELREDNTILRMKEYRDQLGLNHPVDVFNQKFVDEFDILLTLIAKYRFKNSDREYFACNNYGPIEPLPTMSDLLKRANLDPVIVLTEELKRFGVSFDPRIIAAAAIETKYSGYIAKSQSDSERFNKLNNRSIKWEMLVASANISNECRQRIAKIRPTTFSELRRIEGIRPATLSYVAGCVL